MVVPEDEDSFEFDPEEELDIDEEDNEDSDEIDEEYVPECRSGGSGESDGEGDEILKEGLGIIQRGQVKFIKRGG